MCERREAGLPVVNPEVDAIINSANMSVDQLCHSARNPAGDSVLKLAILNFTLSLILHA